MILEVTTVNIDTAPHATLSPVTPDLDIRKVGDGPKRTAVWLDGVPIILAGLEEWPNVGDRFVIDGELWRVVEVSDRVVLTREPS
jgi:hypothetical protein